jgi:hypothetical protein
MVGHRAGDQGGAQYARMVQELIPDIADSVPLLINDDGLRP